MIWIQLGYTQPKGVLWYSMVQLVMLFHSTDKMQVVACGVIKAKTLYEEAIKARTSPPSDTHVKVYMAVVNGEPSGTQPLTPDRGRNQISPSDLHLGGRTPHQLQVNLGDLGDDELWQLMEDLCQEVALQELYAPQGSTADPLGKSSGTWGSQCGWPEGHLSERGRVETNKTTTSPPAPTQPDGGWEPRGQPLWFPAPAQPDEYVVCLINTLTLDFNLGPLI